MELKLSKDWFENRIQPDEDFEVGAGAPAGAPECTDNTSDNEQESTTDEEFAGPKNRTEKGRTEKGTEKGSGPISGG